MKPSIRWVALAAALTLASQAQAVPVTFTGLNQTSTLSFVATQDGASLNASVQFTLTSWTATTATFSTIVSNMSSGPGTNRLMSFGIGMVTPMLSGASTNNASWSAGVNQNLPSFQTVSLCIWDSNNCSGGNINNGLGEGASASFNLMLTTGGNFMTSGIQFSDPYGIKFQDVGRSGQSFEFAGCILNTQGCGGGGGGGGGGGAGGGGGDVPEPDILALIAIGALAAGLSRRFLGARRG
ncbi:cistern family PEP-CTERM protein [Roseateles chitosanitabidus]|uniref:cistern family PEP-CTERM protein n=1 Tax=Roseateles chitosanitabidus TaxID=65048 RepID=UPI000830909F|nr:cistern family PEP-CTERM protein [Roseateles chitosanitabidus]MBO9688334.1 cistern family PEP-CTERM protein [Roseateles chitosanitabidus]